MAALIVHRRERAFCIKSKGLTWIVERSFARLGRPTKGPLHNVYVTPDGKYGQK